MSESLVEFCDQQGYYSYNVISRSEFVAIKEGVANWTIIKGTLGGVSDIWSYNTCEDVVRSYSVWISLMRTQLEPEGWLRHQPSDRRRENVAGRVIREWIAP